MPRASRRWLYFLQLEPLLLTNSLNLDWQNRCESRLLSNTHKLRNQYRYPELFDFVIVFCHQYFTEDE